MDVNHLADQIYSALVLIHARTYRNKSPQAPVSPYVVFRLETVTPAWPSLDFYLNVDIYDKPDASARAIETLADSIFNGFEDRIIRTEDLNAHFTLEQRQYVSNADLVESQMVNLRFVVRAYFI